MSDKKVSDGGAAFPGEHIEEVKNEMGYGTKKVYEKGISMRDYFAAKAMQSCYSEFMRGLANNEYACPPDWQIGVALDSYAMADAMLKAREVQS